MPKKGGEVIKNTKDCNAILKECYAQYRIKLFNYCLARLEGAREDADDCVQDSFLVLQQKLNDFGHEIKTIRREIGLCEDIIRRSDEIDRKIELSQENREVKHYERER